MTFEKQNVRCDGCKRLLPPDCVVALDDGKVVACCGPRCAERTGVKTKKWTPVERDRFFQRRTR